MSSVFNFVTSADFSGRKLNGPAFFTQMEDFTALRSLKMNSCALTYIPNELVNISSLEYLYLEHNNIADFNVDCQKLKLLKCLDCRGNLLSEKNINESISSYNWLTVLDIGTNFFTELPTGVAKLQNLTYLDLSSNRQVSMLLSEVKFKLSLKFLIISNCHIDQVPTKISHLKNLEFLDLSRNPLKDTNLDKIGRLKNLRILKMANTHRNEHNIGSNLVKLINLEELYLSSNEFTNIPDGICRVSSLKVLDMSSNQIRKINTLIEILYRVEILFLSDNEITKIDDNLTNLQNLRKLYLNVNKLTTEGLGNKFDDLHSLELLNLSLNPINILPESIKRCFQLKQLYVEYIDMILTPNLDEMSDVEIIATGNDYVLQKLKDIKNKQPRYEINTDLSYYLKKYNVEVGDEKLLKKSDSLASIQKKIFKHRKLVKENFLMNIGAKKKEEKLESDLKIQNEDHDSNQNESEDDYLHLTEQNFIRNDQLFSFVIDFKFGTLIWKVIDGTVELLNNDSRDFFYLDESYIVLNISEVTDNLPAIYVWSGPDSP